MKNNAVNVDVCIIGASIAGNYLAYLLSKTNLDIAVIEEHDEVGLPFQCAGIVSQKLGQLIDLPKEVVLNRVNIAKVIAPSGKFLRLSGDEEPYVIDRVALDKLFYDTVKNNDNIIYYLGEKFKSFSYVKDNKRKQVLIETSKRSIMAKILIGCDGPLSLVAKTFDIKNEIIYGAQIRIKGNFSQNEAVLFFDPRWKELIGWIVPEGLNNIYRIGVASAKDVNKNLELLLEKLHLGKHEKIDQQGGIIPYGYMNNIAFNNVLLLGDAAGQVKATTGGGIVMLLIASKYAAMCIRKCFKLSCFSKKFIKRHYEKLCNAEIGKQLKIHYALRKAFENFTNNDFENLFQIAKTQKIEQIISLYGDMDFPKSLMLRLLRNSEIIKFLIRFIIQKPILFLKLIRGVI
jgi:flavin-dependent dehydrogenase